MGELDNRGSHFYLALYWAQELANQDKDPALKERFTPFAKALADNEETIINELNAVQGKPVDLQGYYFADDDVVKQVMRPSNTFNEVLASL